MQANLATVKSELTSKLTATVNGWWESEHKNLEFLFEPESLKAFKVSIFDQLSRILRAEGASAYEAVTKELSKNFEEIKPFLFLSGEYYKLRRSNKINPIWLLWKPSSADPPASLRERTICSPSCRHFLKPPMMARPLRSPLPKILVTQIFNLLA